MASVRLNKLGNSITSSEIENGSITNDDINASASIATSKLADATDIADAISKKHSNALDHSNSLDHANTLDHTQNTDSGTTNTSFEIDSDGTNPIKLVNVNGELNAKTHAETGLIDIRVKDAIVEGNLSDGTNTASIANVKDAVDKKHSNISSKCHLYRTSDQILADSTFEAIEWDEEFEDTQDWHNNSSNPERVTCGKGIFFCMFSINLESTGNPTRVLLDIRKNGVELSGSNAACRNDCRWAFNAASNTLTMTGIIFCDSETDYISCHTHITGTSARRIESSGMTYLKVVKIGDIG